MLHQRLYSSVNIVLWFCFRLQTFFKLRNLKFGLTANFFLLNKDIILLMLIKQLSGILLYKRLLLAIDIAIDIKTSPHTS